MKKGMLILGFILSVVVNAQEEEFVIQINNTAMEVSLDKEYNVKVNGKTISFSIFAKDTVTFKGEQYSFQHPKDFKASKVKIDTNVEQVMLMTAEGSGIAIQEFSNLDPTTFKEFILQEVTRESLGYGYKMERETFNKTLASGQKLEVIRAILTYEDEVNIYEVAAIGKEDQGIIIMTMVMDERMNTQGAKIIDMMWNSLKFFK